MPTRHPESDDDRPYVGRFAPSPTGPLHIGSLLAAAASYLDARQADGRWLLRIEDIDPPREQPGADTLIISALEHYGFEWDEAVSYQSGNTPRHESLVRELLDAGKAYPCRCSRRDLADAPRSPLGAIYPGTCRSGCDSDDVAIRVRTDDDPVCFDDRIQGRQQQCLESESGDFVILRRDGLIAYHLAVAVDDADQGITDVVRGIDLMASTPRQIYLQRLIGLSTPRYAHVPVVQHDDGAKLSKLTGAEPIPLDDARPLLIATLGALRLAPPAELRAATVAEIWAWGAAHWDPDVLRGCADIALQHYC